MREQSNAYSFRQDAAAETRRALASPASRPQPPPETPPQSPDIDVPTPHLARHDPLARADLAGWLAPQLGRADDRFEIGQRGVVIMRARGIEQDQVEPTVDHRADRRGPCATIRRSSRCS